MRIATPLVLNINGVEHAAIVVKGFDFPPDRLVATSDIRCDVTYFDVETRSWRLVENIEFHTGGRLPEAGKDDAPTMRLYHIGFDDRDQFVEGLAAGSRVDAPDAPDSPARREPTAAELEEIRKEIDRPADFEHVTEAAKSA